MVHNILLLCGEYIYVFAIGTSLQIDIIIIMSNLATSSRQKTSDSNIKEEYDQFVFN